MEAESKKRYPKRRKLIKEDRKLSQRIRELRTEQKMTQEELSGRLGRNLSYIAFIESGRNGLSLPVLYRLAKVFGVKVRDLVTF